MPVSRTEKCSSALFLVRGVAALDCTSTLPTSVNLIAFETRLTMIWRR